MDNPPGPEPSLTKRTIIGTAWLLLWRAITRSLGLISMLVLARLLTPTDFGLIAMATAFSLSVEALSQLGLQAALIRRRGDGLELHNTAFTLQLGRAVVTALVLALGAPLAAWWFGEPRLVAVLFVLAGVTLLTGFENVGIVEYYRTMRFDMIFRLTAAPRLVGFVITITMATLWPSYWSLLAGIVASAMTRVFVSYWWHPFRPWLSLSRWRELASFSVWIWATASVKVVWDRCDAFVLGPVFGSAGLGKYMLSHEIALLPLTEFVAPASEALFAAFSRAQKDGQSSVHYAGDAAGIVQFAVVPMVITISAAAGPIIEVLLGQKWSDAWPIVAVLTWACVFSPFSYVFSMVAIANGYVRANFIGSVIVSALKLATLIVATAFTSDMVVIASATAACIALESATFVLVLRGKDGLRLRPILAAATRLCLATAMALGAVYWSGLGWGPGLGGIGANLLAGFAIGAIASVVFGAAVLVLWLAFGRPAGPEARLLRMLEARLPARYVPGWIVSGT